MTKTEEKEKWSQILVHLLRNDAQLGRSLVSSHQELGRGGNAVVFSVQTSNQNRLGLPPRTPLALKITLCRSNVPLGECFKIGKGEFEKTQEAAKENIAPQVYAFGKVATSDGSTGTWVFMQGLQTDLNHILHLALGSCACRQRLLRQLFRQLAGRWVNIVNKQLLLDLKPENVLVNHISPHSAGSERCPGSTNRGAESKLTCGRIYVSDWDPKYLSALDTSSLSAFRKEVCPEHPNPKSAFFICAFNTMSLLSNTMMGYPSQKLAPLLPRFLCVFFVAFVFEPNVLKTLLESVSLNARWRGFFQYSEATDVSGYLLALAPKLSPLQSQAQAMVEGGLFRLPYDSYAFWMAHVFVNLVPCVPKTRAGKFLSDYATLHKSAKSSQRSA